MKILGLDEAGRGSVLGPLVIGATMIHEGQAEALGELGVTDSKMLTRIQREMLYPQIQGQFVSETVVLEPDQLEENLTQVELKGLAKLINLLKPDQVFLDAPVAPAGIPKFVAQLRSHLQSDPEIIAENKADLKYDVVAAASIIAKVTRDQSMLDLQQHYGDLGWGYPGEPKTIEFLKKCVEDGNFPDCVRTRWATVQKLKQRSLFD